MKALIAVGFVFFALWLCNLTGKRANTNTNDNTSASGTKRESVTNDNSTRSQSPQPPGSRTLGSGIPPSSRNQNSYSAAPPASEVAPPPRNLPGVNQNTASRAPRAPISGGVLNGKAISLPKPAYPAIAKAAHVSGVVNVQVLVDESGNVVSARAVSGHPLLQQSAVAAARQAKFSPTILSGQAVKVMGILVYNFVAQ